ncbi:hypothetical protein MRX96_011093 [Rhipicephalus microplus]
MASFIIQPPDAFCFSSPNYTPFFVVRSRLIAHLQHIRNAVKVLFSLFLGLDSYGVLLFGSAVAVLSCRLPLYAPPCVIALFLSFPLFLLRLPVLRVHVNGCYFRICNIVSLRGVFTHGIRRYTDNSDFVLPGPALTGVLLTPRRSSGSFQKRSFIIAVDYTAFTFSDPASAHLSSPLSLLSSCGAT